MRKSLEDSKHMLIKSQGALVQALATIQNPPLVNTSDRGQTKIDVEFDCVARADIWKSNEAQLKMAIADFFTAKIFLAKWLNPLGLNIC